MGLRVRSAALQANPGGPKGSPRRGGPIALVSSWCRTVRAATDGTAIRVLARKCPSSTSGGVNGPDETNAARSPDIGCNTPAGFATRTIRDRSANRRRLMRRPDRDNPTTYVVIGVVSAAIAAVDVGAGIGYGTWVLYFLPLTLAFFTGRPWFPVAVGSVFVLLLVVGYSLGAPALDADR